MCILESVLNTLSFSFTSSSAKYYLLFFFFDTIQVGHRPFFFVIWTFKGEVFIIRYMYMLIIIFYLDCKENELVISLKSECSENMKLRRFYNTFPYTCNLIFFQMFQEVTTLVWYLWHPILFKIFHICIIIIATLVWFLGHPVLLKIFFTYV